MGARNMRAVGAAMRLRRDCSAVAPTVSAQASVMDPSRTTPGKSSAILWFRKGLRLHDNPALMEACTGVDHVYPVYIMDPRLIQPERMAANRLSFLLESLQDLQTSLKERGSQLVVLRGSPESVLADAMERWAVSKLCFEKDTEPYATERDAAVRQLAEEAGVTVVCKVSHTLYDPAVLVERNGGRPPLTMGAFTKLMDSMGNPSEPLPAPQGRLPGPQPGLVLEEEAPVPRLEDLGYAGPESHLRTPFKGGETQALQRLDDMLVDAKWVCDFEKPKGNPASIKPPATTVLSPYLKFGCLSPRLFHNRLIKIYRDAKGKHSKPPVSLRAQLIWREFFTCVGTYTPNFDKMAGNPICRQIDWDDNPSFLQAWEDGKTGFPWIDAIMRQLKAWGWMHHLARHSVACFLTRGDLYCSWEKGRDVFTRHLIDADHYLNSANWMWLSASAFFNAYFRVYSPVTFGQKYDKNGDFIRHFVPELKDFPAKWIYSPWEAPIEVQRKAGCLIGHDYPDPIVDHKEASSRCMQRMKAAYAATRPAEANSPATPPLEDGRARSASKSERASPPKPAKGATRGLAAANSPGAARKQPAKKRKANMDGAILQFVKRGRSS